MPAGADPARMRWSGWGDPARAVQLPAVLREQLAAALGLGSTGRSAVTAAEVRLPQPALPPAARQALTAVVGGAWLRTDHDSRLRHTRGKSTPDLLLLRGGDGSDAPDAVLLPADHEQVLGVLRACTEHRVAVVPFGGGTSVVGGLTPDRAGLVGVVAVDLRRLDRLEHVDPVSRTATLQAGLRGPAADAALARHGLTLGHLPQSYEYATLGGFAAAGSAGQASAGYGRFADLVVRLRVATPVGTLELGRAPASAAGPDLRQLLLGSEGVFGVITSLTVRVRPLPAARDYRGWVFPSFTDGLAAVRRLAQDGPLPTVLRLSDETETMVGLADPTMLSSADPAAGGTGAPGGAADRAGGTAAGGALAVVGHEGAPDDVRQRAAAAGAVLAASAGHPLGPGAGEAWRRGRFSGPYLRDALLDLGVLVETLETAAFWAGLVDLYSAVRTALTGGLTRPGHPPLVLCHVSHVYPEGASLYFTVAAAQADDPVGRWRQAKRAATDAIVSAGGTVSHHHGVGRDHRPWLTAEIGPLGVAALRAVKRTLDPAGVLNPGVLLP